ncbi:hypothetical protein BN1318_390017 [Staphylococcus capitis]|nr:hypothetical protein BN1318_390017 [Staphylococcus capitis]
MFNMNEYIRWFIKDFLGEVYISQETLGLWMLQRSNLFTPKTLSCDINFTHYKQMTIFDVGHS